MLTLIEPLLREARVDTAAIRGNARILAELDRGLPLLADVSADGYGHGALETAIAALDGGVDWLAVSSVADAAWLRSRGIRAPILASFSLGEPDVDEARKLGVTFRGHTGEPQRLSDAGAALYGLGPEAVRLGLVPAMRVSTRVVGTKTVERGEGVSYGYTFRATDRTNLAMVGIGYADGLDRRAGNAAAMSLGGRQRMIAGRVAMNVAVLDLGHDTAVLGDEAVLFGGHGEPSAAGWAGPLGITDVEAATVFGRSLPRRHL